MWGTFRSIFGLFRSILGLFRSRRMKQPRAGTRTTSCARRSTLTYRDVELTKLRADTWRAHYDMVGRTNAHVDFGWMEAGTDEQTTAPRLKKAAECRQTDQEALMLSDPAKLGVKL